MRTIALGFRRGYQAPPAQPALFEPASAGAPEFLVDGFSGRHRLVEWPEFHDLIERRGLLEWQRGHLLSRRETKMRATGSALGYGGVGAIRITMDPARLTFSVRDGGVGFDPSGTAQTGHGLENLTRRAARLKGRCRVDSAPGRGTLMEFDPPFKSRST